MRSFYLFKNSNNIYYVQFVDPVTRKRMSKRSTGMRSHEAAEQQALEWLYSGTLKSQKETQADRLEKLIQSKKIAPKEMEELRNAINLYYKNEISTPSTSPKNQNKTNKTISAHPHNLIAYLKAFWNYDTSYYVKEKLYHGKRIGKRYCYDMTKIVTYWEDFFAKDYTLEELTTLKLKEFEDYLSNRTVVKGNKFKKVVTDKKLSNITKGNIIKCGSICFKWAVSHQLIDTNPCDRLITFSTKGRKRGILSVDETLKLFKYGVWQNEMAKVGNMLAFTCGLRLGEIRALQKEDIGDDRLWIRHSYSDIDKLKCTKNGKDRIVPLPDFMRSKLLHLHMTNPHKTKGDNFIFWGMNPNVPLGAEVFNKSFRKALYSIDLTREEIQERNIVFHSWRHTYATYVTANVDVKHAQKILGHSSIDMTEYYADHEIEEELLDVAKTSNILFKKIFATA